MSRTSDLGSVQVRLTGTAADVSRLARILGELERIGVSGMSVRVRSPQLVQGYLTVILPEGDDQ
jgi:hypothetical protein